MKFSDVVFKSENAAEKLLQWFKDNRMKANCDKHHFPINNEKESFQIKISNETVTSSKYEKLLGRISMNISHSLLCKKASQKLNAT